MLRQYGTRCQPRQYVKVDTHAGPPASLMQDRQLPLQHVQARRLPTLQCAGACSTARNSKAHGQVPLRARAAARRRTDSAGRVQRALWCVSRAWPTTPPERAPRKTLLGHLPRKISQQQRRQSLPMPPTNHSTQPDHCSAGAGSTGQSKQRAGSGPSQSVRSATRASAAVLGSACAPTDASCKRPARRAAKEGDRRAEEGTTALPAWPGPEFLAFPPRKLQGRPRHPSLGESRDPLVLARERPADMCLPSRPVTAEVRRFAAF